MQQVTNIVFLRRHSQILLAMKKRGHGAGKWNGVGGKALDGETPEQAAIRECHEEIDVTPQKLELIGSIDFFDKGGDGFNQRCYIYETKSWIGKPTESEEMKPQWFDEDKIPYDQMWPADRIWLPYLLAGKQFEGTITFDGDKLISQEINELANLAS